MIGEDYCYVPLTKTVYSYGMSDRVEGFEAPRNASPEYWAQPRLTILLPHLVRGVPGRRARA